MAKAADKLLRRQVERGASITKAFTNYKNDPEARKTLAYIDTRIDLLRKQWEEFEEGHNEVIGSIKDFEAEYFTKETYSTIEDTYTDLLILLNEKKEQLADPPLQPSPNECTSVIQRTESNLPKIKLPSFDGHYDRWIPFRDLFRSIVHNDASLSNVQKLHHLKTNLNGEAELLVRNVAVTAENYSVAWKTLTDRYDNNRVLVNTHLQTIFEQPNQPNETAQGLRNFLDQTLQSLRGLEGLGIDTSSWDTLLIYLLVQKLPIETHKAWEQRLGGKTDLPTLKELIQCLEIRFRTLEAIDSNQSKVTKFNSRGYGNRNQGVKVQKASSFYIHGQERCNMCKGQHSIIRCSQFLQLSDDERNSYAREKGLCLNCLGQGHLLAKCFSNRNCLKCGKRHHSLLHMGRAESYKKTFPGENKDAKAYGTNSTKDTNTDGPEIKTFLVQERPKEKIILLATALVEVSSSSGQNVVLRALIDQGSQATFVTENTVQRLRLHKESVDAVISGLGGKAAGMTKARVHLKIKSRVSNVGLKISAFIMKKLTALLPTRPIHRGQWDHLNNLMLADPQFCEPGKIDLLLGADVYSQIVLEGVQRGMRGSPVAQNTSLGWIVFGEIAQGKLNRRNNITNLHLNVDLNDQIRKFWEMEELKPMCHLIGEEKACEQVYKETVRRTANGRYTVKLPFTQDQRLGKSRDKAIKRFIQLERSFNRNPSLKTRYAECINDYATLGHMVLASTEENEHITRDGDGKATYTCSYLPHHAVFKENSSTTKLRVVFDASCATDNGKSLNDILMKGPTIQDDIATLLMRWRKYKIAITADITKMYRQVRVPNEDANFQRIVWRNSEQEPIRDYCLQTVTFGTTSAPFLAIRTLTQVAQDEVANFPIGSQVVQHDFYVDDLMSGGDDIREATLKQNEVSQLLLKGGFQIRKWISNAPEVLKHISVHDRELGDNVEIPIDKCTKALGVCWFPSLDQFGYNINVGTPSEKVTKRQMLSDIAKLFDPLGWLAPTIVQAKILMQHVWLSGIAWDDILPENTHETWIDFRAALPKLEKVRIQRWLGFKKMSKIEIHGFSDASQVAYAAAVYIRTTNGLGGVDVNLLTAKTRVAPLKSISLPRLELCGATLLAKLIAKVRSALKIESMKTHAWTDSTIVLAWIQNLPCKWKTFVANKVSEIHDIVDAEVWRHVPSSDNPADHATRGLFPEQLAANDLWWTGPKWLKLEEHAWPRLSKVPRTEQEAKLMSLFTTPNEVEDDIDIHKTVLNKCSSLSKLLRVTAYIQRFVQNCKNQSEGKTVNWLTAEELSNALKHWVRFTQNEYFPQDIRELKRTNKCPRKSKILNLNPFIDAEHILRVGGRLQESALSFNQRHPMILPEKSVLTERVIEDAHRNTLHGGPQLMLCTLRKRFWIINARNKLRQCIHRCIPCFRQKGTTAVQLMGNLPMNRVQISRPFTHTGVDYCGPFNVKTSKIRNAKVVKGYVAVFVCLCVKAIHIEVVSDLSTPAFIAAFRRFVARRGICSDLYSDCGTNFVGASVVLNSEERKFRSELNEEMANECSSKGTTWHFNPPSAPHFGGLWEVSVKSIKHHLKRVIGKASLTYEELSTILTQIEACLNSRPLCPLYEDSNDETPLTPGHFLTGDALLAPPEPNFLNTKEHLLSRWQLLQKMYQHFWHRWSREYLSRLQQRPKWLDRMENISPGAIVLLKDENTPPTYWPLGRVLETYPGKDGNVRVVKLRVQNSIKRRPITKLCLLPVQTNPYNKEKELVADS